MNTDTNTVIYEVDATDESVQFSGNSITFSTVIAEDDQILPGTQAQLQVQLDEGVALPKGGGGECGSEAKSWEFTVKGKLHFKTQ